MAVYRQVYMSFWTDTKIDEEFTPEDKYFYLYLMTNPHTNLCGCYEIGVKQMARETGYNEDTIRNLIYRMENVHNVVRYNRDNKELLLKNWHKYNWTMSDKLISGVLKVAENIKTESFKEYVEAIASGEETDTVSIGYTYPMDTSVTVTVTDTVTDTVTESKTIAKEKKTPLEKAVEDFVKYRRLIKKPMTDRAKERLLKELENLAPGDDQKKIDIMEYSMYKGWVGVFRDGEDDPTFQKQDKYSNLKKLYEECKDE